MGPTRSRAYVPAGSRPVRLAHDRGHGHRLGPGRDHPGPLIMVVQFVGFVAAYNNPGALPRCSPESWAPRSRSGSHSSRVSSSSSWGAVRRAAPPQRCRAQQSGRGGAAVVGVIANLGVWFAVATLFDSVRVPVGNPASAGLRQSRRWRSPSRWRPVLGLRWGTLTVLAVCAALGAGASLAGVV